MCFPVKCSQFVDEFGPQMCYYKIRKQERAQNCGIIKAHLKILRIP